MNHSLLGKGLYSIPEAARILRTDAQKVRRWVMGNTFRLNGETRISQPLLHLTSSDLTDEPFLTFQNLIELLFISIFRNEGVSVPTIRAAAAAAESVFKTKHPFAVQQFETDGKHIFAILKEQGVDDIPSSRLIADLNASQMVMDQVARQFFRNLDYNDQQDVLRYWPLGKEKSVVLDPHRSFGRPIDHKSGVSTYILYQMARSGSSPQQIADWYGVDEEAVRDAIDYESALPKAA